MPGIALGSRSEALALIKKMLAISAPTPNTTETCNATEMPCANFCASLDPAAAWRCAVANAVVKIAKPSEPPTCCITFSSPDADPDSCGSTPATATMVSGTNKNPMPRPKTTSGPSKLATYVLCTLTSDSHHRPDAHITPPSTMNGFGPTFTNCLAQICALTMIAALTGRKMKPVFSGL